MLGESCAPAMRILSRMVVSIRMSKKVFLASFVTFIPMITGLRVITAAWLSANSTYSSSCNASAVLHLVMRTMRKTHRHLPCSANPVNGQDHRDPLFQRWRAYVLWQQRDSWHIAPRLVVSIRMSKKVIIVALFLNLSWDNAENRSIFPILSKPCWQPRRSKTWVRRKSSKYISGFVHQSTVSSQ